MKRYHLLPHLVPKGVTYEMKCLLAGTPNYQQTAVAWQNILDFLWQKWYRRFPFRLFEPWISWECHATGQRTRFFLWAPNHQIGAEVIDRFTIEHFDVNIEEAEAPQYDFSKPHYGMKLLLERDFSVPIRIYSDSSIDSYTQLVEHMSNVVKGEEMALQILVRPVYDYQVRRTFKKALRYLQRDRSGPDDINQMYLDGISQKFQEPKAEIAIKILGFSETVDAAHALVEKCYKALSYFNSDEMNRFVSREWWQIIRPIFRFEFEKRIFPLRLHRNAVVLGTSELAGVLRMPTISGSSKFIRLKMRRPHAPVAVRDVAKQPNTIYLGNNVRNIYSYPIHISLDQLNHNFVTIGASNTGKTTLLLNLATEFLRLKSSDPRLGITIIDTEGDLANTFLERIPPEFYPKVRAVRFRDGKFPFNPYDFDYPITQKGGQVVEMIQRIDPDTTRPIATENLVMIGLALYKLGIANFRNIQRVVEEREFCNWVADQLDDRDPMTVHLRRSLKRYLDKDPNRISWPQEFVESYTLNRIRSLNTSKLSSMLNTYTCGIRWLEAIDEGQILVFDLSGLTPLDKRFILVSILVHIEAAQLSRKQYEDGFPCHPVILDEASHFLDLMVPMEIGANYAREHAMPFALSIQGIKDHIPPHNMETIFRNYGTQVVFQLGHQNDAKLAWENMRTESIFQLTPRDFFLCSPPYAYMQHMADRSEVFILKPKPLEKPIGTKRDVEKLLKYTLKRALKQEEEYRKSIKLGTKPIEEELQSLEEEFDTYLDILYEDL